MRKDFCKPFVLTRLTPIALAFALTLSMVSMEIGGTAFAGSTTVGHGQAVKSKTAPPPVKKEAPAAKKGEGTAKEKVKDKATLEKEFEASLTGATQVDPLVLLKEPSRNLNKKITFTGTFNRFADIALDYKKAFRDSRDYVTFFILRPDVPTGQIIPLSELKLFFPRKKSVEVMELESGDKIQIVGTEFSTALDEPWVDVEHIRILQKTDKPEKKHTPPEF